MIALWFALQISFQTFLKLHNIVKSTTIKLSVTWHLVAAEQRHTSRQVECLTLMCSVTHPFGAEDDRQWNTTRSASAGEVFKPE